MTEAMLSVPPPAFEMFSELVEVCGLEKSETNWTTPVSTDNCAEGAVTFRVTAICCCAAPEQAEEVQATVTVPEYGEPAAERARPRLFT